MTASLAMFTFRLIIFSQPDATKSGAYRIEQTLRTFMRRVAIRTLPSCGTGPRCPRLRNWHGTRM
jgi:hypothetical protein